MKEKAVEDGREKGREKRREGMSWLPKARMVVVADGCPSVSFGCGVCKEGSSGQRIDSMNKMYV